VPVLVLAVAGCSAPEGSSSSGSPGGSGAAEAGSAGTGPGGSGAGASAGAGGDAGGDAGAGGNAGAAGLPGSFWHLESPADSQRTWLVAPDGTRVFGLGVNTVMRDKTCDGIVDNWIRRADPTTTANTEWARLGNGESNGQKVDKPYCFNNVGAFSDTNDFDASGGDSYMIRPKEAGGAGAPYSVVVNTSPKGNDRALKDEGGNVLLGGFTETSMGDPFNPAFRADLDARFAEDVAPRKGDPRLQMWFAGNETGIFDRAAQGGQGVRDFRRWIWSDCPAGSSPAAPACARHALASFLSERYGASLPALNAAWQSGYAGNDFAVIVDAGPRPVPYVHDCNQTCREDLQVFVHDRLLKAWVVQVTTRMRAADPNHLIATPRLALANSASYRFWAPASGADPDMWADKQDTPVPTDTLAVKYSPFDLFKREANAGFDLIAVNVYTGDPTFEKPWFTDGVHKMMSQSGLPLIVSELSVRARIDGWSNKGGAGAFVPHDDATDDQIQRGAYYKSQIEQLVSFRGIVGASWHAWSDRFTVADDAHQINMGLVQCDDPPRGLKAGQRWDEIDDRVAETNCGILGLIAAKTGL
jgi:hypothetical protein